MTWNPSLIDGPLTIYTYGPPDAEGVSPVTGTVPGYHLNAAPQVWELELELYLQTPTNPRVVFAGDGSPWATQFLKFADEAEAKDVLSDFWIEELPDAPV